MNKNIKIYLLCIVLSSISMLSLLPYFDYFEFNLQDKRFIEKYVTADRKNSIKGITIAAIDSRSIKKMGRYHSWSRDYFAASIDILTSYKTSVAGFDILFDHSINPAEDTLIAQSLQNSDFVILGYNFNYPDSDTFLEADSLPDPALKINSDAIIDTTFSCPAYEVLNSGSPNLHNLAAGSGYVNMEPDLDGVTRRTYLLYRYFNKLYPSLALKTCLKHLDITTKNIVLNNGRSIVLKNALLDSIRQDVTIPLAPDNSLRIHYTGPRNSCRTESFYDVINDRVSKKAFKNKIVLIGATAQGLYDLKATPVDKSLPGVEVHANVINTILTQNFITEPGKSVTAALMLFSIVFIALFFLGKIHTYYSALAVTVYTGFYIWLSFYLFNKHSILIDQFHVLTAMLTTAFFAYLIKYFIEEKDKKFIKNTLGRYVPEVVSNAMLKDSSLLKLGGERKEISMFFSDIRDFTKISEKVSPEILVKFLNIYLSKMTSIIKNNQGTLDKFMGDAIICFFGAPLPNRHAFNACKTALEIIAELDAMRPNMIDEAFKNIRIGIGINTGDVTVGNIGSMELFDYTAIGDNMNLASRLEGLNKYYGTSILISDSTLAQIKDEFITREVDTVTVKGKSKPVVLHELLCANGQTNEKTSQFNQIRAIYFEALNAYKNGDFNKAKNLYKECLTATPEDKTIQLLYTRCLQLADAPPANWNGVWSMTEK